MEGFTVAKAVADVGTAMTSAIGFIGENPILVVFIGFTIIGAGAMLFKKLRRSAK